VSERDAVPPLPAAVDESLTRLLARWAERHQLTDDSRAAAARIVAAARASQLVYAEPYGYDWWRAVLAPTEQVLAAVREIAGQGPPLAALWPLGSAVSSYG